MKGCSPNILPKKLIIVDWECNFTTFLIVNCKSNMHLAGPMLLEGFFFLLTNWSIFYFIINIIIIRNLYITVRFCVLI